MQDIKVKFYVYFVINMRIIWKIFI